MPSFLKKVRRIVVKEPEGKAFEELADLIRDTMRSERGRKEVIEALREVRQRGHGGPARPDFDVPGLDDNTLEGDGPVVAVFMRGDPVPRKAWKFLIRDWET